jgi:hypothetical protein
MWGSGCNVQTYAVFTIDDQDRRSPMLNDYMYYIHGQQRLDTNLK